MRVLVTGANGVVGRRLCRHLTGHGHQVVGAVRSQDKAAQLDIAESLLVGDFCEFQGWDRALTGVDAVVHLAARVHQVRESTADSLQVYRRVNTTATIQLVDAAMKAGVHRFVYVSTAHVNGLSSPGRPFTEQDPPAADTPYAQSKLEGEEHLARILAGRGMQYVIVRPALVYGPGIKGNLYRLMQLVTSGLPLPFRSVRNQRSMIGLSNLTDFLEASLLHPKAAGQCFLVSDGRDLSTPEIIDILARGLGVPSRLIPCPVPALTLLAALVGRGADMRRLCDSFQVDSSKARELLGWTPTLPVEQGMQEMAAWFNARHL